MTNHRLKSAIYSKFETQREFSVVLGLPEIETSKIVTGRKIPSEKVQRQIARAVGRDVCDLFEVSDPE